MGERIFNLKFLIAGCYFFLVSFSANAQSSVQPLIKVAQMEYAYDPQIVGYANGMISTRHRVILPTDSLIAAQMKKSFLKAIDSRWNAQVQETNWDLKKVNFWKDAPKFKPKLKSKEPGSWHLFFQVFDNGPYPISDKNSWMTETPSAIQSLDNAPFYLQLKVVLLDGANGETVYSNEMSVAMRRTTIPDDRLLLRKVPGMTASFLQAFDSAMRVFFGTNPVSLLELPLVPAFVFIKADSLTAKAIPLTFKVSPDNSMVEESTLRQQWEVRKITTEKLGRKGKFGANLLGGTFTMLTGVGTERVKAWKYMASIVFKDVQEGRQFTCKLPYIEEDRDERIREKTKNADGTKSYNTTTTGESTRRRFVDTESKAWFLEGTDTIGSFQMSFGQAKEFTDRFTHCWDGRDSASITTMPEYWNNSSADAGIAAAPVFLEGSLYGKPFIIQNTKEGNQLDLLTDGRLLATLNINYDRPLSGFLFGVPDDTRLLKAMCMLSSLPFRYFY